MPGLNNYQEEANDNWDDLLDNNDNLDDILRTSLYSNRSTASSNRSPMKPDNSGNRNDGFINLNSSQAKKKPYQSISLQEFESQMAQIDLNATASKHQNEAKALKGRGSPLKKNQELNATDTLVLKTVLSKYQEDSSDELENDQVYMTLKKAQNQQQLPFPVHLGTSEDSDLEDGIEFPEDFSIPRNSGDSGYTDNSKAQFLAPSQQLQDRQLSPNAYFKPTNIPNNTYSSTLDLSPANSSFSGSSSAKIDNSSSNSASIYSESETDATDFYNDIEFQNDDFEQLLELRLRKARYQAEMEEREFYMNQQYKKSLNKKAGKMLLAKKDALLSADIMDLPDDSFICSTRQPIPTLYDTLGAFGSDCRTYDDDEEEGSENEEHFLEDFEDFEQNMSFAIERDHDMHRNVIVRSRPGTNRRSEIDLARQNFYNHQTGSEANVLRTSSRSPTKRSVHSPNNIETFGESMRLSSKKSMPTLRSASIAPYQVSNKPKIRKASSSMLLNMNNNHFTLGGNSPYKRSGNKKVLVQPVRRNNFDLGNELDNIDDLDVNFTQEKRALTSEGFYVDRMNTMRGSAMSRSPQRHINLSQYMEKPTKPIGRDKKSILKNTNSRISPSRYDDYGQYSDRHKKVHRKKKEKKIGLIKHLSAPQRKYAVEGYNGNKMVYNPATYKWEGNEVDAKRFATIKSGKQPALITFLSKKDLNGGTGTIKAQKQHANNKGMKITSQNDSDFEELSVDGLQVEGNMYFNPKKLCWISLNPEEDSDDDPFKDIIDLEVKGELDVLRQDSSKMRNTRANGSRMASEKLNVSAQRFEVPLQDLHYDSKLRHRFTNNSNGYVSRKGSYQTINNASEAEVYRGAKASRMPTGYGRNDISPSKRRGASGLESQSEFYVTEEFVRRCRQEEERWARKVKHWFQPDGDDEPPDRDYLHEIRNMVMGGSSR